MSTIATEVMGRSPYDLPGATPRLVQIRLPVRQEWVPSRYNARTVHPDGRLILWNTYTGAISVFTPEQRAPIEALLSRKRGLSGEPEGLAKYLSDRGFLIRREVDEFRKFRLDHGRDHYRNDRLELILLASEDCNFRCTYCYEDFARGTMQPEVRQGVKALLERRGRSLRTLSVEWFGGEPLYGWEAVSDLAPWMYEFCKENQIGFSSHMTTNAYLLTPDIAAQLLSWNVRDFQITLDGMPEVHDQRRVGRDGSGTFHTILANLKAMHEMDAEFSVTLRMNYDRDNLDHLVPLLDLLRAELGTDPRFQPYFFAVERWGSVNDNNAAICGLKEADAGYWHLMDAAKERGMNTGPGVKQHRFGSGACYAARPNNFIVGATGKLMKCTVALDKEDHNVVGQLTPEGDLRLNRDRLSAWTGPIFEDDKVCRNCHVLPICQGMFCPLERIEGHERECHPVKRRIRKELIHTVDASEARARQRRSATAAC